MDLMTIRKKWSIQTSFHYFLSLVKKRSLHPRLKKQIAQHTGAITCRRQKIFEDLKTHMSWLSGINRATVVICVACYFHKHEQMRPTNCIWEHYMQISLILSIPSPETNLQTWTSPQSRSNLASRNVVSAVARVSLGSSHRNVSSRILMWNPFQEDNNICL